MKGGRGEWDEGRGGNLGWYFGKVIIEKKRKNKKIFMKARFVSDKNGEEHSRRK